MDMSIALAEAGAFASTDDISPSNAVIVAESAIIDPSIPLSAAVAGAGLPAVTDPRSSKSAVIDVATPESSESILSPADSPGISGDADTEPDGYAGLPEDVQVFEGRTLALLTTDEFPLDAWFPLSSSHTAQVTIPGPIPPTSISREPKMLVIFPLATSLPTIVSRLSPFKATASMLPALLISNWRGSKPPAGKRWTKVRLPLQGETRKVNRLSDGI
jgi:hypothetical protein